MGKVTLGRTKLVTDKNGFGALPIQRISVEDAGYLLQKAYENGITYFDTARAYTDSEEKIGKALSGVRNHIILATKTAAKDADGFWRDMETSLQLLKTDFIDVYQFHNPPFCPKPGGADGLYDAALKAREQGKIRFIGITNHHYKVAKEAVESGLYDTLQFPFNYLSTDIERSLVEMCREREVGFLAMKALSGGLLTNASACYAYLDQYAHVLPLWGIQKESELDEFIEFMKNPPSMDEERKALIEKDIRALSGEFCRGCGYCMPCPMGIEINNCARMSLLLRRSPSAQWLSEDWQKNMAKIKDCIHCNQCAAKCPYHLNTPELLGKNLADYENVLKDGLNA
ncbi:aldo/keto reductase [bacterium C-53]|nr:aldo/keto reductase [Lachnospiraceae bacterium]NBI01948.1 aldo/keto reductase [Lachnospiraceae bacterium]RKJ12348.1 aldo/keto reductase [bacterium C-53]